MYFHDYQTHFLSRTAQTTHQSFLHSCCSYWKGKSNATQQSLQASGVNVTYARVTHWTWNTAGIKFMCQVQSRLVCKMHTKAASPIIFYINLHISVNKVWVDLLPCNRISHCPILQHKQQLTLQKQQHFSSDVLSQSAHIPSTLPWISSH